MELLSAPRGSRDGKTALQPGINIQILQARSGRGNRVGRRLGSTRLAQEATCASGRGINKKRNVKGAPGGDFSTNRRHRGCRRLGLNDGYCGASKCSGGSGALPALPEPGVHPGETFESARRGSGATPTQLWSSHGQRGNYRPFRLWRICQRHYFRVRCFCSLGTPQRCGCSVFFALSDRFSNRMTTAKLGCAVTIFALMPIDCLQVGAHELCPIGGICRTNFFVYLKLLRDQLRHCSRVLGNSLPQFVIGWIYATHRNPQRLRTH